jgi:hypothetical protein
LLGRADTRNGKVCYAISLRLQATRSGIPCPEFELASNWDTRIVIEGIDEHMPYVDFGDQSYPVEGVLNPGIANHMMLPSDRTVEGYLLATGTRHIPDEFSQFDSADCMVTVRDHGSGEILETVITQLCVMRSRKPQDELRPAEGSLYRAAEDSGGGHRRRN